MLGRYAELKAQLPEGTILFYQVGTFFETFEEDAKKISQALSIRLTSREAAGYAGGRVPLAGVPNHALEEHTATLLRKGYSVAAPDQAQAVYAGDLTHPHAGDRDRGQCVGGRGVELPGLRIDA